MMQSVNLIPASRRAAQRRRRHLAASAAACAAYALLLACGVGAAHLLCDRSGSDEQPLDRQLATVEDEVRKLDQQALHAAGELTGARATLEAQRTVAEQPDWSVLLALLAETTGDDVVLRSVSITPPSITPVAGAEKKPAEVMLEVGGVGRTQLAVSRHLLRLEHTGLFAKVTLIETNREPFMNAPAIAFRVQCSFGEAGGSPAQSAAVDTGGINR